MVFGEERRVTFHHHEITLTSISGLPFHINRTRAGGNYQGRRKAPKIPKKKTKKKKPSLFGGLGQESDAEKG